MEDRCGNAPNCGIQWVKEKVQLLMDGTKEWIVGI